MRAPTPPRSRPATDRIGSSLAVCLLMACSRADSPGTSQRVESRAEDASWFTDVSAAWGLDFRHASYTLLEPSSGELESYRLPEIMGGGVALFDCDGDGDLDLYLVDAGAPDRLFVQRGGRFHDATERSGLGEAGYGMGAAVGDVEGDGDLDLYVTHLGPDRLYLNRGDGTFADHTRAAGIDVDGWSTSAAFADLDGDGRLDLFVVRYVDWDPEQTCLGDRGGPDWCGPKVFDPLADVALLGRGDGTFVDASARAGLTRAPRAGLGVVCTDVDDDGRPEVYVANDAYPNQLWVVAPDGPWRDAAAELGVALGGDGAAEAGMGLVAEQLEPGGPPALFVTNLRAETNTLYRRGPSGRFRDRTDASGLGPPSRPFTGFGVCAFDAELDGDLDLAVANGHVNRGDPNPYSVLPAPWNELAEPDHFFLNDGAGGFSPAPAEGAGFCRNVRVSRGLAAGDLDGDGDVDLVVGHLFEPARVLRNDAPRAGNWLAVRAVADGVEQLGARVRVDANGRTWTRSVARASSYLSSSDAELHFGLGPAPHYASIEVRWPDGATELFPGGRSDRRVVLERGRGAAR